MANSNARNETANETIPELIDRRQAELGLDDDNVAVAIGYAQPKVIAMVKAGSMRLPINKAIALADALKVPRFDTVSAVLNDQSPELWNVIRELLPVGELAESEVNLIRHLRKLTKGRTASPIVLDGAGVIALVTVQ